MAVTETNRITEKLSVVKGFFAKDNYLCMRISLKAGLRRGYKYDRIWFKKDPFI